MIIRMAGRNSSLFADYHSSSSEVDVGFHLVNFSSSHPEEEANVHQLKSIWRTSIKSIWLTALRQSVRHVCV